MDNRAFYFDNAATTPLDPRVLEAMLPWLSEDFGNAHSLHHWGRKCWAAVEEAREAIAELVDSPDPSEIVFTSGATEANNWVIQEGGRVAYSPFEHSSVRTPSLALGHHEAWSLGWHLKEPNQRFDLLSAMLINNETGCFVDASSWFQISGSESESRGAQLIHRDLTQAAGKVSLHDHAYDLGTFSAHKFGGPKGVGVLHMRDVVFDQPFILGGDQENRLRGGTLNVAGIVGMGEAAKIALDEMEIRWEQATINRAVVLEELQGVSDMLVVEREPIEGQTTQSPYILSCAFAGVEGETLAVELDGRGFGVSSGAACSAHSVEPSHVLTALGLPENFVRGAVRISFGPGNTPEASRQMAQALKESVSGLRQLAQS